MDRAQEKAKNGAMAAHLREMGYPHGRRATSTNATHNYPNMADKVGGSAKYKRYLESKKAKRI